jgi:hypothetical protein
LPPPRSPILPVTTSVGRNASGDIMPLPHHNVVENVTNGRALHKSQDAEKLWPSTKSKTGVIGEGGVEIRNGDPED